MGEPFGYCFGLAAGVLALEFHGAELGVDVEEVLGAEGFHGLDEELVRVVGGEGADFVLRKEGEEVRDVYLVL